MSEAINNNKILADLKGDSESSDLVGLVHNFTTGLTLATNQTFKIRNTKASSLSANIYKITITISKVFKIVLH